MSAIVQVSRGDYVIASTEKKKAPFVLKVSAADRRMVSGVCVRDQHIQELREVLDIDSSDVLINLGEDPRPGKIYGCDVTNLYRFSKDHDSFGPIYWFYRAPKDVRNDLMRAFDKVHKLLSKHGLEGLAGDKGTVWEVLRYNKERYSGMYKHSNKEGVICRLQIRPEIMPASEYPYVIAHELGHRMHLQYVKSKKINASWIKTYNTSIRVTNINKASSAQLLEALLGGDDVPSDFRGQLEEEQELQFKWILRYIAQNHGISVRELDTLFEAGEKDEIAGLWPTRSVPKRELKPIITEYAATNYRETIAEAFAYYLTGKKIPKVVTKLLERTISYAKTQLEKQ